MWKLFLLDDNSNRTYINEIDLHKNCGEDKLIHWLEKILPKFNINEYGIYDQQNFLKRKFKSPEQPDYMFFFESQYCGEPEYLLEYTPAIKTIYNLATLAKYLKCNPNENDIFHAINSLSKCVVITDLTTSGIEMHSFELDVEIETDKYILNYPFTPNDLEDTIDFLEFDVRSIWLDTHGCPECGSINALGYITVFHYCAFCNGRGVSKAIKRSNV